MSEADEIGKLRKAGRIEEAAARATAALRRKPDEFKLRVQYGWVIYEQLKRTVAAEGGGDGQVERARGLMWSYAALELRRPDLLFSLLLAQLTRLGERAHFLPGLLAWAGPDFLRAEDRRRSKGDDRNEYQSLLEQLARANAKAVLSADQFNAEHGEGAVQLLDNALKNGNPLYVGSLHNARAKLLVRLGRAAEAEDGFIPVVRAKQRAGWAWGSLAEAVEVRDPELALCCAVHGSTLGRDGTVLPALRKAADLAKGLDRFELARWAVDRACEIRESKGWRVSKELQAERESDWYRDSTQSVGDSDLREYSARARAILIAALPEHDANCVGRFRTKDGKKRLVIAVRRGIRARELVVNSATMDWSPELGQPVAVRVDWSGERPRVMDVQARDAGNAFDALRSEFAVLEHHNPTKQLSYLHLGRDRGVPGFWSKFPALKELAVGDGVAVKTTTAKDDRINLYAAEPAPRGASLPLRRTFGPFQLSENGVGFIEDVFVPPPLAKTLTEGENAYAWAIMTRRRGGRPSERALRVEPARPHRVVPSPGRAQEE